MVVWDETSQQYYCDCPVGYVCNASMTECILNNVPDCNTFYKNSIAVWDGATQQYLCNCPQGYIWNQTKTECIANSGPDCNAYYKNPYAYWDYTYNQYMCACNSGYEWNSTRTECVPVNSQQDIPNVNPQQMKNGECNIQYMSGANEAEQYTIDVISSQGSIDFSYDTYIVKDRIHIYYWWCQSIR